jgi:hypothetical protein
MYYRKLVTIMDELWRMSCRNVRLYDPQDLDYLIYLVDRLLKTLQYIEADHEIVDAVGAALTLLEEINGSCTVNTTGYLPRLIPEYRSGRPRFDIQKAEQLEHLLSIRFNCRQIADIIGVSLSTVRRRMAEFGLSVSFLYSKISDQELDQEVLKIKHVFPNCGYRMMEGHLNKQGIRVPQARIRECFHRVDPIGISVRWSATIK